MEAARRQGVRGRIAEATRDARPGCATAGRAADGPGRPHRAGGEEAGLEQRPSTKPNTSNDDPQQRRQPAVVPTRLGPTIWRRSGAGRFGGSHNGRDKCSRRAPNAEAWAQQRTVPAETPLTTRPAGNTLEAPGAAG